MTAHHFFVSPDDVDHDHIAITGDEAHHLARVLRVRAGEHITVSDNHGLVFDAVVRTIAADIDVEIIDARTVAPPRPAITIHQALMKGDRMDDMIEKAVELGVARIAPFAAERSVVQWDVRKRAKAHERWTQIARAAAKQSRSPWLTAVDAVGDGVPSGAVLVLHEEAGRRLREALPDEPPPAVELVVGPEGGLSPDEVAGFDASALVSLGPRILRTEVAGPVAAAIIAYAYGSLG